MHPLGNVAAAWVGNFPTSFKKFLRTRLIGFIKVHALLGANREASSVRALSGASGLMGW
jgi:hypothetical protein